MIKLYDPAFPEVSCNKWLINNEHILKKSQGHIFDSR